ncbi:serine/threonine-protein kinase [Actinomadura viridis]|uniref:serine/threonine-protein kinase n=1 Tax=Actinomadura viridis TaxID=58110 RepID=UPI003695E221
MPDRRADHEPDRVLAGRYRLLERLGRGGMGTVWSAEDRTLGRPVAVKEIVFPDGFTADERRVATGRARREARAAALIDHPGVITVHDVVVEDGRPWIVMELVRGPSLEQVVARDGPRPPIAAAGLGLQVLDALRAAHARGIVHRDVKPGNVLFAENGRMVLTDFGIASIEADPSLTRTGSFVGSPGYIAPERLRERPGGPESDLWSLGATLYMAVEGRPPFERDGPMAVLGAVLTEEPAPPRQAGSLAPLLWHLLQKEPSARPDAETVARVLRNVAAGGPSGLPDPVPPRPSPTATAPPGALPSPAAASPAAASPGTASPGTASHGTGSRASRLWIPVAAGAAMLLTAVTALAVGVVAFSGDGREESPAGRSGPVAEPTAPGGAGPSASPASPRASTSAVDLCALLTAQQIRRLLPSGTPRPDREDGKSCGWTTDRRGLAITDIGRGSSALPPESAAEAHNKFVAWKNARSEGSDRVYWGWTEIGVDTVRARQGAARTAPGIGDEAFAYETTGITKPMDKSYVVLRVKKTVLEVQYAYERGTASPDGASRAARWVAESLAGRS